MGVLFYGDTTEPIQVSDRLLAHIKVVIATKLRRNESFTLSWRHDEATSPGRSTIWVNPAIPLRFVFDTAEDERLDPAFLRRLATDANSSGGLTVDLSALAAIEAEPRLVAA